MNNTARQTSQASQAQFAAFIGRRQLKAIQHQTQGAEGAWFRAKLAGALIRFLSPPNGHGDNRRNGSEL